MGVVSEEKLLDLLELAMSSDTAETVKRARDLMDSGVDPMTLTSQLAGVITNIIAGTHHLANSKSSSSFFAAQSCKYEMSLSYKIHISTICWILSRWTST